MREREGGRARWMREWDERERRRQNWVEGGVG